MATRLFRTWRAAYRWERAVDAALSRWKLGYTRYQLLDLVEQLQQQDAELSQSQLTSLLQLTESGVHRAVMALVARNLLQRDIDEYDAAWNIFITEEGKRLLATTKPIVEALAVRFARELRLPGFP